jgi:hypothetical protein
MRFRLAVPSLAVALLFLAGCGPAVIKPPIPLEQSLLPATIYVPDCPSEDGFSGFMDGPDRAMGESACRAMSAALVEKARGLDGKVKFVAYKVDLKAPKPLEPDTSVEASIGTRYRIVLRPAQSSRIRTDRISYVAATEMFTVLDIATGTRGWATVEASPGGVSGATKAAETLIAGVRGPRCEALNSFSARTAFHVLGAPKCTTFMLYPSHRDDDDEDEDDDAKDNKPAKAN